MVTGRVVPEELLEETLRTVPASVKILAPYVDYHVELSNAANEEIKLVTEGETWDHFTSKWLQTCAWVPSKRIQAKLSKLKSSSSANDSS
jgi:hypothetical protein